VPLKREMKVIIKKKNRTTKGRLSQSISGSNSHGNP
jgi:hypothetical protein